MASRQALFGPTKGKFGLEIWRYKSKSKTRYSHECCLMWHGKWLHKHYFRIGSWVYAIAWNSFSGKSHL